MPRKKLHYATPTDPIRVAAVDMSKEEARKLLTIYFDWVRPYMAAKSARVSLAAAGKTCPVIRFTYLSITHLRDNIEDLLGLWVAANHPAAKYFLTKVNGVGPATAAGLAAYIDIDKCKSVSSVWKYAGLAPNSRRLFVREADAIVMEAVDALQTKHGDCLHEDHIRFLADKHNLDFDKLMLDLRYMCHGGKQSITWGVLAGYFRRKHYRPDLRHVCIVLGNSIIKAPSMYQDLFRHRYAYEIEKNARGDYAALAAKQLARFDFVKGKVAYDNYIKGRLPAGHLVSRARRYAVKILLAHYYEIEYYIRYGKAPQDVYGIGILHGKKKLHIPGNWYEYAKAARQELRKKEE